MKYIHRPIKIDLVLGEHYLVNWAFKKEIEVKFIRCTEKNFNFLNIETNKCVLKQHLYKNKKGQLWKNTQFLIAKV
jgi:hypothetical protein